jgi:SsrA-binding protein
MATLVEHRRAKFDYEILEKYEAGIELIGTEVKSVRAGQGKLEGARAIIRGGEAYIVGMDIPPYQKKNAGPEYESDRTRKVLLSKKEIADIARALDEKGLTAVPLSLYTKGRVIKVALAIAKGKKNYDKREAIKKRDTDRELRRGLKS